MSQSRSLSRREVLVLLGGASVVITAAACGGGSSPSAPSPTSSNPPASGDKPGTISSNHGHEVVITGGQLQAGGAVTLQFTGSASHTHSLDLSASEVVSIRGGTRVSKESSDSNGHSHTVTFN